jgi:hypothetical protein
LTHCAEMSTTEPLIGRQHFCINVMDCDPVWRIL